MMERAASQSSTRARLWRLPGGVLFAFLAAPWAANAQVLPQPTRDASPRPTEIPVPKPAFRFNPGIEVQERHTDNVTLLNAVDARSDWVTDTAATINAQYRRRQADVSVDFRINKLFHERFANLDTTLRNMKAVAKLEPVEKWLFLDARGDIGQQNRSVFGPAGISDISSISRNRIETSSYQIAPSIRGNLTNAATYMVRANASELRTGDVNFPDSKSREWTGNLKSAAGGSVLGWALEGNRLSIENDAIQKRQDSRVRASLTFAVDQQLHLSAGTGREYSDLDGKEKTVSNTPGFGIEWSLGPRTQLAALTQKRFFGNDHLVVLAHRTALTTWRFSSAKEIAIPTNEPASSNPFSVNNLLLALLASSIPEGAEKLEEAQKKFEETGVPSISGIRGGVLFIRPLLNRRENAAIGLKGLRNTITIEVERREQRAIDGSSALPGTVAPIEDVRQRTANATWAYRLSRVSVLRLNASYLHAEGLSSNRLTSTQRLQGIYLSTQLSEQLSASASVQRVRFESTLAANYRETSYLSAVTYRF